MIKSNLRHLVHSNFKNNPALCYLPSTAETFLEEGIPFRLLLLHSLQHKPSGIKVEDPFMPPFEEGLFISDLSESHSLVFNKFCVCENHVIAFPKAFEH
jgi:ATP adenylyltransferase/5',5'''-P-1,P-4-tetraphosphate phosphorylase II